MTRRRKTTWIEEPLLARLQVFAARRGLGLRDAAVTLIAAGLAATGARRRAQKKRPAARAASHPS